MDKISTKEALTRLQKICSLQEKCISDIRRKLNEWGIPAKESQEIIEKLKKDKFIDEERYAICFVRDKYKINKWGREKIKYALIQKSIPEEIIKSALSEIRSDIYNDTLKELLTKKKKEIKSKNIYEIKGKLIRFGTQKGYNFEIVYRMVDEVLGE